MTSTENDSLKPGNDSKKLSVLFSKPVYIFIISIIINSSLFALFFCFITPRFRTNDDIAMMEFASGRVTGQPGEYLVYINIVIGKLLSLLYLGFPEVNWYPVLFYFIHFISMTVIFYCLLLKKKNIYAVSIYILLFSFLEMYLLANIHFTTTAFIAGLAGVFLFFTYIDTKGIKFYIAMAGSILLMVVSGLIRENVFYLVIGLSAGIFLLKFLEVKSWKIPAVLLVAVLLLGLLNLVNDYYYQEDEEWGFYQEYNKYIGKILGYPDFRYSDRTRDVYERVGWSENDVRMLKSWFYCDPELYSLEKLDYVVSNISVNRGVEDTFNTLKGAFDGLDIKVKWFTGLFLAISILLMGRKKNKYIFSVMFFSFVILVYLCYRGRMTDWVFSPIVIFNAFTAAFFLLEEDKENSFKSISKVNFQLVVLAVCLIIFTLTFISVSESSGINIEKQQQLEQVMKDLEDKDKIYVGWGATGLRDKVVFFSTDKLKNYINVIQLGWRIHTPYFKRSLEKYSIDNLYTSIAERDDIFMICGAGGAAPFKTFMAEHYDKEVSTSIVYEIEGFSVNVYKFRINNDID